MASSYYSVTTNNFFDNTQSQSIPPTSHYSSYQLPKSTNNNYDVDDDDDLDALRKAALQTLNIKKRKNDYDHSPTRQSLSRSSSRSYSSSSSSSSRSTSRSYSSSSLSSISSNSLHKHDKDYRFEKKTKDIDERFPQDIPNDDMLIVNCPIQDDDLLIKDEPPKSSDRDERRYRNKSLPKEIKRRKKSPPIIDQPVSITVKLNSNEFDLRELIKKRRMNEKDSSQNNHRTVQILPKDNELILHKPIHDRLSSGRRILKNNYHKH